MERHKIFDLPEWNEALLHLLEDTEEWKIRPSIEAAKALYDQWREVFHLVMIFSETLSEEEESDDAFTRDLIYENAIIVAPKIMSVAGDIIYILKMENASIIRTNCRQLMEQIGFAVLTGAADEAHEAVIEQAMEKFRFLFREWVATFEKDDYEDEWGLFL